MVQILEVHCQMPRRDPASSDLSVTVSPVAKASGAADSFRQWPRGVHSGRTDSWINTAASTSHNRPLQSRWQATALVVRPLPGYELAGRHWLPRCTTRELAPPGPGPALAGPSGCLNVPAYLGSMTLSMTWITPLSATMSVAVTLAPSTITPPAVATVSSEPCTVLTLPAFTSLAITLPATTW
jgi:hypothetical protein